MDIEKIEIFLEHYQFIATIIILPLFGFLGWGIPKLTSFLINKSTRIDLKFKLGSSIVCPNHSITDLEIVNQKKEKLILDKIELTVYDDKNEYYTTIYNRTLEIESESAKTLEIEPVSHYGLEGEFVDIHYLFSIEHKYYFTLYCGKKKILIDNKYLFKRRGSKRLNDFRAQYNGVVHSFDWDYGFVYKNILSPDEYVGFMNKRQIFCRHIFTDELAQDTFTPELLKQMLLERGCIEIKVKRLIPQDREYTKTIPRMLGQKNPSKKTIGTRENPIVIDMKNVWDFRKETE